MREKRIYIIYDGATGQTHETAPRLSRPRLSEQKVIVDSRRVTEQIPCTNDARGWDQYRLRRGIAGR